MAFLVRKISRAKWPNGECHIENLEGDAVADLRTTGNTLSLWRVNSESELPSAALALAASSRSSKIESISIVWLSENDLINQDIMIDENSPGDTVIADLANTHRDLCNITYRTIGILSELIIEGICQNRCKRFTRSEMKAFLVDAYKGKRVSEEKCTEELLSEIHKALNVSP